MRTGEFLNNKNKNDSAVLGIDLARKLFGMTNVQGRLIEVAGKQFLVNGVMDESVLPTLSGDLRINSAVIISEDKMDRDLLRVFLKLKPEVKTEETKEKIMRLPEAEKVQVKTEQEAIGASNSNMNMVILMLSLVAGVALFIGGIGVMNIMLVAAGERMREIGIRKAVGASFSNILAQFLVESVILSFLGGVIGVVVGVGVIGAVALFWHIEPFLEVEMVLLAIMVSVIVGVIFGVYPAGVAAKKSPIAALKHYR